MNIDIDTAQATPTLTIKDDQHLCHVVYLLASHQLLMNGAETAMQAKVEAAKKAFADATANIAQEIKGLFAAVEAYASLNKDRLFPLKGDKRSKTLAVLAHKLQYRSSDSVESPANAVEIIRSLIKLVPQLLDDEGQRNGYDETTLTSLLESLIRQPDPELNKEAVKALANTWVMRELLHLNGIRVKTSETFKLAFAFTPEQSAS